MHVLSSIRKTLARAAARPPTCTSSPSAAPPRPAAARRALARLPEKVAVAVVEFLYCSLAASPDQVGKPLKLGLEGLYSARRGDYRVIYRIDDDHRRVDVPAIEHRSDIYRPRQL